MVIWKIEGNEIGNNGNAAAFFPTKEEADKAIREYRDWCRGQDREQYVTGPTKIVIRNREELASALNDATGYGAT